MKTAFKYTVVVLAAIVCAVIVYDYMIPAGWKPVNEGAEEFNKFREMMESQSSGGVDLTPADKADEARALDEALTAGCREAKTC